MLIKIYKNACIDIYCKLFNKIRNVFFVHKFYKCEMSFWTGTLLTSGYSILWKARFSVLLSFKVQMVFKIEDIDFYYLTKMIISIVKFKNI